ncbi:uncharacterized protein LY89DRAFT_735460 [Mollisia scopiformis]|uniref:Uncharacterized protein n=1 Tax=Mollisia scopiformis TaxID=149040 RepID=A0A194X5I5_MOLSC|nr:uncharacterized protein LY89DRAFT_735460 [Mollisia scopiformis]KUJ15339.1 hypothetical protein LY89DRAFT_735460 [Mollisia scopiformis]
MAIIYNNHEILKLLHADLETIRILSATPYLNCHRSTTSADRVVSARKTLQQRSGTKSEILAEAFEELIAIIEAEPSIGASEEDLMESGFFSCRSTWNMKQGSGDLMEKDFDSDLDTVD